MYSMVQIRPIIIVVIVFKLIYNTSNMENSLLVHFQAFVAVSSLEFMYTYLFYATINHTCAYCNNLSRGCHSYCIFCRFVIMFYRDLLPFIVDCCASIGTKNVNRNLHKSVCMAQTSEWLSKNDIKCSLIHSNFCLLFSVNRYHY